MNKKVWYVIILLWSSMRLYAADKKVQKNDNFQGEEKPYQPRFLLIPQSTFSGGQLRVRSFSLQPSAEPILYTLFNALTSVTEREHAELLHTRQTKILLKLFDKIEGPAVDNERENS